MMFFTQFRREIILKSIFLYIRIWLKCYITVIRRQPVRFSQLITSLSILFLTETCPVNWSTWMRLSSSRSPCKVYDIVLFTSLSLARTDRTGVSRWLFSTTLPLKSKCFKIRWWWWTKPLLVPHLLKLFFDLGWPATVLTI